MMEMENDAALIGGEQTSAPVAPTPAPAEEAAPTNVRGTVRAAYDKAQADFAERQEKSRPAEPKVEGDGENTGKPTLDRSRDPQGRFAKGEGAESPPVEKAVSDAPEPVEAPTQAPATLALKPPPGWNAAARVAYANLPQEVKEAVAKRESDVAAGFQAFQKYKGLETYTPMIEASGISHAEFTKRAVEWEQSLRSNPVGTVMHVAKLANVDLMRLAQQMQQQGGQGVRTNPVPAQQPTPQQPQQQPDFDALINQKLAQRDADTSVNAFLSDPKNVHAEAVADDMALLITNGRAKDLAQAYDMACNMHPEIRALLIRQASATPGSVSDTERARRTASEAKAAAKATIGAPSGPRPDKQPPAPTTVRGTVRQAYEAQLARL